MSLNTFFFFYEYFISVDVRKQLNIYYIDLITNKWTPKA